MARSSIEAEYCYVAATTTELRWVFSLLLEFGVSVTQTPIIYYDNIRATNLYANLVFQSRMKHVALDYHFIREQVQIGSLCVAYVSSGN